MSNPYKLPPMSTELGRLACTFFDADALRQIAEGAETAASQLTSPDFGAHAGDRARFLTLAGACRCIVETLEQGAAA